MDIKIGTHNGSFHCDEALACFMLHQTKQFQNAPIVRTRDPEVIKTLTVVVDVGGVYDPATLRFDHHQASFQGTFSPRHNIRLSSAGLVYLHFGREVISSITKVTDPAQIELLHLKAYEDFIQSVDAIDNGVNVADGPLRYRINTDLSSRVGRLNPSWRESNPNYDEQFRKAVALTGEDFTSYLRGVVEEWLPARVLVEEAMLEANRLGKDGNIIKFNQALPWKEHLLNIEKEQGAEGKIQYVLYPDEAGKWRIQAVPKSLGSFESRTPLPAEWRGVRDENLSQVTGIDGCVFVHASGFIGGNATFEGALRMATRALEITGH